MLLATSPSEDNSVSTLNTFADSFSLTVIDFVVENTAKVEDGDKFLFVHYM